MGDYRQYDPRYPLLARRREPLRQVTPTEYAPYSQQQATTTAYQGTQQQYAPQDDSVKRKRRRNIWIWIIVIIVAVIVIGVLVWFFFFRSKPKTTTSTTTTAGALNSSCSASSPCAIIFSCDSNVCKSVVNGPCTSNTDCSQAQFSLECTGTGGQAGQCRHPNGDPCGVATDCVSGFCNTSSCAACTQNSNCATNQTCNTTTGRCQ